MVEEEVEEEEYEIKDVYRRSMKMKTRTKKKNE